MATTWLEHQVLSQLCGHVSEVGIDNVRHQMASRRGIRSYMRKHGMLEELRPLASFDEEAVNRCPALTALATNTGNCLHCIQDAGVGRFDPTGVHCMYIASTDNCEVHQFRGDCCIERVARRNRQRVSNCIGVSGHATSRERLPYAFVSLDNSLLAACQQQLIRQCTKPDRGAFGDCYAFGVRSLDGLRDNHERVMTLRLHVIIAARILWAPNTVSRVYDWVPVQPICPDGIYRLDRYLDHIDSLRVELNYDIVARCGPPVDYYTFREDGSHPWLAEGEVFGPANSDRPFLEAETCTRTHGATGRMRRRGSADSGQVRDMDVLGIVRDRVIVTTKDIANALGVEKKTVNRILYGLMDLGAVHKIVEAPPTWASTDESAWGKVVRSECGNSDCAERRLTEQDLDAGRDASREMNTTFDEQRKDEVLIGDPQEVDRGDHRSTPENPITGFSIHPTGTWQTPCPEGMLAYQAAANAILR